MSHNYFKFGINHIYVFRHDPVPYTGKNWGSFSYWYKRPKIMQEKRWNIAHIDYVRGKRHPKYLPDSWDDVKRGDCGTRKSWKNNKKRKQWMK